MRNNSLWIALIMLVANVAWSNDHLLNSLHNDEGWEYHSETGDGLTLRTKSLSGYELQALEVGRITDLTPETIVSVLEDVASYNEIITSNQAMECHLIGQENDTIYGYQYYRVPLMKNRSVVFEMRPSYTAEAGRIQSDWVLLTEEQQRELPLPQIHMDRRPTVIEEGAGTWLFEPDGNGQFKVSYRLYMNPGGWMPDFVLENVNRKGIAGLYEDVLREAARREELNTEISEELP